VWDDPDRYVELYRSLHAEVSACKDWKPTALQTKYDEISKRYPQYEDFDPIGTRLHVLYPDARWKSNEELEGHFADITRFQAILCARNPQWNWFTATSDNDLSHLVKYVGQVKDTKFQLRLERAIGDFYVWRTGKDDLTGAEDQTDVFNYRDTTVRRVEHFAENRYGVHFKNTNEWGLYCFFVFDDGRISYSYYRSDNTFQQERHLDVLSRLAEHYRNPLAIHQAS
jgi:hypothetical protein